MKASKIFLASLALFALLMTACGSTSDDAAEETALDFSDKTLAEFMNGDITDADLICHHSSMVADSELEVMTYMSGNMMRLEYMMIPPIQGQGDLTIVSDGEYMYMWGDSFLGQAFGGMKMALEDDVEEVPAEDMAEVAEFIDFNMPMTECAAGDIDESYFTIPTDVEFMDMSALEESMMNGLGDIENMDVSDMGMDMSGFGMDCSICDQMPADKKQSCLDSMGCE